MIVIHWLLMHRGKNLALLVFWAIMAWSFYGAGIRWNASDEQFMHRGGQCLHTHDFCTPPGPKRW